MRWDSRANTLADGQEALVGAKADDRRLLLSDRTLERAGGPFDTPPTECAAGVDNPCSSGTVFQPIMKHTIARIFPATAALAPPAAAEFIAPESPALHRVR